MNDKSVFNQCKDYSLKNSANSETYLNLSVLSHVTELQFNMVDLLDLKDFYHSLLLEWKRIMTTMQVRYY